MVSSTSIQIPISILLPASECTNQRQREEPGQSSCIAMSASFAPTKITTKQVIRLICSEELPDEPGSWLRLWH